jgi:thiamine-monophosphate kinase
MRESELLAHIFQRSAGIEDDSIRVGPGDDCAVVRTSGGDALLLTVDQLIEGRHFRPVTDVDLIGRKAVARSVSDIAAMGGRPLWGLGTGALPSGDTRGDALFDAMAKWAKRFGCPLVGGDIASTDGPLALTVTVIGIVDGTPALRSDARAGDGVYVTGSIGGSLDADGGGRHLTFEPRVAEGLALREALGDRLGAMIDLSDGLGRDAGRVAARSKVRIEIEAERVPLSPGAVDVLEAMRQGEDYELLFTARGEVPEEVTGTRVTRIARVVEGEGCIARLAEGRTVDLHEAGWDHG